MVETTLDTEKFDETDIELLEYIEDDFDVSLDTLAERLELSKSAVHYRVNKMKQKGIITGVTANLDPVPFGLDMVAITEVSVTHSQGYSENIGEEIAALDGIEQVYYTMGDVDFVAILRVQDRVQMNDVIEQIVGVDGVNKTSSRFVMDELTSNPKFMSSLSAEMKQNLVSD